VSDICSAGGGVTAGAVGGGCVAGAGVAVEPGAVGAALGAAEAVGTDEGSEAPGSVGGRLETLPPSPNAGMQAARTAASETDATSVAVRP
jgi:hypothetical protein